MGIFDKAKDMLGDHSDKIPDLTEKAKDALDEHGDKIPGGLGDKAKDALDEHGDKIEDYAEKLADDE